jgi:phosphohistidine phosphatase
MKLYLVRHATATEQLGGNIRSDAERPLVEEGKKEAQIVAQALRKLGAKGDVFLTSPLVRTRQTAEIFSEVFGAKDKLHYCETLAPGCTAGRLYKDLKEFSKAEEIFLFGHMPDMTTIASELLFAEDALNMPFKKAGVARIDVYDLPPTTPGTLKWFITPKIAKLICNN